MKPIYNLAIFFVNSEFVRALSSFTPNCTLPDQSVNIIRPPTARSTWDLLSDCITVLFLCTWSIQHLNIPAVIDRTTLSAWAKWRVNTKLFLTKLKWMVITVIMPELIVAFAIQDWLAVRFFFEKVVHRNGIAHTDGAIRQITKSFVYFANMGGVAIRVVRMVKGENILYQGIPDQDAVTDEIINLANELLGRRPKSIESELDDGQLSRSTQVVNDVANQGPSNSDNNTRASEDGTPVELVPVSSLPGIVTHEISSLNGSSNTPTLGEEATREPSQSSDANASETPISNYTTTADGAPSLYYFNALQLYAAYQLWLIRPFPNLPDVEIEDKSKGDIFIKGTAVLKMIWLLYQTTRRAWTGLPISQLELATVSFCVCMMIAYAFYWSKPQGIMTPKIYTIDELTTGNIECLNDYTGRSFFVTNLIPQQHRHASNPSSLRTSCERWFRQPSCADSIPNDLHTGTSFSVSDVLVRHTDIAFVLIGMMFGLINCVAWNYDFPSDSHKKFWRGSSVTTAAVPFIFAALNTTFSHFGVSHCLPAIVVLVFLGASYVTARCALVYLMCMTLFWQPPATFVRIV